MICCLLHTPFISMSNTENLPNGIKPTLTVTVLTKIFHSSWLSRSVQEFQEAKMDTLNLKWTKVVKIDDLTWSLHIQTHYSAVCCSFHVDLVSLFSSGWEGRPEQQLLAMQTILFLLKVDHITLTLSPPEAAWRTKAQGGPLTLLVFSHIHGHLLLEIKRLGMWIFLGCDFTWLVSGHSTELHSLFSLTEHSQKKSPDLWVSMLISAFTSLHSRIVRFLFLIGFDYFFFNSGSINSPGCWESLY